MATKWTDEKHRLYLDSIEASFVKQLYNSEYSSNDLLGSSSRTQIQRTSSYSESSNLKNQSFGRFKVLHRGCWEKLKSEKANIQYENESQKLPTRSWIQHFKSNSTSKEPHITSEDQMVENNLVSQSNNLIGQRHGREATSSKQPPPFLSQKVNKVSVGSITEVSDQNFADMEVDRGDELKKSCGMKRARNAVSPIKDQVVVPLLAPTLEKIASLNENNEECCKMNLENMGEPHNIEEPQASSCKYQQPSDPNLRGWMIWPKRQKAMHVTNKKKEERC